MEISSVDGAKNWEVTGEDENILCAYLEESLFPGEKITLNVCFLTKLAKINHRTGIGQKSINLGNFYPVLCAYLDGEFYECVYYSDGDPFVSECASYQVVLTVPKEYTVARDGQGDVRKDAGEQKGIYHVRVERPRFCDCSVRLLRGCGNQVEGRGYQILLLQRRNARGAPCGGAQEALEYYSATFGAYPYDIYSVVQTGFCYGGMEFPALSLISDALNEQNCVYTIVHETAHQWWYVAVGSNQVENAWQDEGLTEYSAALFFENHPDYGFTREQLVSDALAEYRSYYNVYSQVFGDADTRMTRSLKDYLSEYEYRSIAYDKGAVLFDTLRTSIGRQALFLGP